MYEHLVFKLKQNNIINQDNTLNIRFKSKLNKVPELTYKITEATTFLQYSASIKVRLHCILQGITEQPLCKSCGAVLHMRTDGVYRYTFPTFCSSKCLSNDKTTHEKRKQTNLDKYGHEYVVASDYAKEKGDQTVKQTYGSYQNLYEYNKKKQQQTIKQKYGSYQAMYQHSLLKREQTIRQKYGSKEQFLQQIFDKQKQTCLKRYGSTNVFNLPEFQQLAKKSMKEKYKVEYPLQHPQLRQKFLNTMKQKHGVNYALQSDQFKHKMLNSMQERYGVPYALNNQQLCETAITNRKETCIERYGVSNFHQLNISPQSLRCLNDKQWLKQQHHDNQLTLTRIAEKLDVAHSTVGQYFKQHGIDVLSRQTSQDERDIQDFIQKNNQHDIQCNTKSVITPQELDIYIEQLNLAFEFNGLFWHSEHNGNKHRNYHLNKTQHCADKGIRMIQIFEHEWHQSPEIIKSRILNILGNVPNRVYARQCSIQHIDQQTKKQFMEQNHIQGDCSSSVNYGLYYNGRLVACMTFGKSRFSDYQYELLRFVNNNNTTVVGGASKLFKMFIREQQPDSIVTYSDKRWNTGKLYQTIGFTFSHSSSPNYFYFKPSDPTTVYSRNVFQKHKLSQKLDYFDPNLTEWENMQINGYDRIWDCGNDVYVWENN